jgi:hypothetical protein
MSTRIIINTLGYAGLIPFVVPAFLSGFDTGYNDIAILTAETYAFGIICFLTGSWWGMSYAPGKRLPIILSNVYFVIAFLLMLFAPTWWSFAAAILLISIFILERNKALFPVFQGHYRKMRAILTLFSSGSMLLLHFAQ